jgi:hypothetical protein
MMSNALMGRNLFLLSSLKTKPFGLTTGQIVMVCPICKVLRRALLTFESLGVEALAKQVVSIRDGPIVGGLHLFYKVCLTVSKKTLKNDHYLSTNSISPGLKRISANISFELDDFWSLLLV